MDPSAIREYAGRDWALVAASKTTYWRERRESLGPSDAIRIAASLRDWAVQLHPEWPSAADREADLAMHISVAESLRAVGRR